MLLSTQIVLALVVARLVFGLPIRGSLVLLFVAGMLCVLAGIGIGTFLAAFSKSQQQAQLMSFLSTPAFDVVWRDDARRAMPEWMQPFTLLNPISHFSTIARGVLLKGAGIERDLALYAGAGRIRGRSGGRQHGGSANNLDDRPPRNCLR